MIFPECIQLLWCCTNSFLCRDYLKTDVLLLEQCVLSFCHFRFYYVIEMRSVKSRKEAAAVNKLFQISPKCVLNSLWVPLSFIGINFRGLERSWGIKRIFEKMISCWNFQKCSEHLQPVFQSKVVGVWHIPFSSVFSSVSPDWLSKSMRRKICKCRLPFFWNSAKKIKKSRGHQFIIFGVIIFGWWTRG